MLVLLLIAALVILSLMFGGFQKGTRSGGLGPLGPLCTACMSGVDVPPMSREHTAA
jgi:hypothetical protein